MSGHIAALSDSVTRKKVVYKNRYGLDITGELYHSKDLDVTQKHPALVVGDRAHSKFFSENAYAAALEPKELYVVTDAEHIDLYDRTDRIPFDKLAEFFSTNLK